MKYVSMVEGSLKTLTGPVYLGPKTLVLAKNKAGKSAIVNAIEVALTGTASDVVGRILVKEVNRLLSLSREDRLWANATVLEGEKTDVVSWTTKGKKGMWTAQPPVYNPSTVFPLRSVREALSGTADTTRKFFIRFVAGNIRDEDVRLEIPTPLHEAYDAVTIGIPKTAPVDMLLAGLGRAQDRLRETRSEVATRKDVVTEAGQGLPTLPSEKEFEAVRKSLAEADVKLAEMDQMLGAESANEDKREKYAVLRQEKENAQHEREELLTRLADIEENWPPKPSEADLVRPHHLEVLKFAAKRILPACPTCKTDLPEGVQDVQGFWNERVFTVALARTKADEKNTAYHAHEQLHRDVCAQIDAADCELTRIDNELERLGEMPPVLEMSSFEVGYGDTAAERDALRAQLTQMELARAAWQPVLRARDRAAEKETEIDKWTRLIDALKAAIGNLLDKGRDAFVARVQRYLPQGDTFGLELHDGDREVCSYGLLREGKLQEALSGVEWAYVTAAIAAAAIPENEKDLLHVVIFEDRAWDADTLTAVLHATAQLDAQVIIATTMPDGFSRVGAPEGWQVVTLGADWTPVTTNLDKAGELGRELMKVSGPVDVNEGTPLFIRDYLAKHPKATAEDLVRTFKISVNRAHEFVAANPQNAKGRGKKKEKEEPKIDITPELE